MELAYVLYFEVDESPFAPAILRTGDDRWLKRGHAFDGGSNHLQSPMHPAVGETPSTQNHAERASR